MDISNCLFSPTALNPNGFLVWWVLAMRPIGRPSLMFAF